MISLKKERKRAYFLFLLCLIAFVGCQTVDDDFADSSQSGSPSSVITLKYYTIGLPDEDLSLVNQELNTLLEQKANFTVEYHKLSWNDYGNRMSSMIQSGSPFDIAFASAPEHGDYLTTAQSGVWLELTPYLETTGKEMYEMIHPLLWEGVQINGKIYGVPTNKELATPMWWVYPKEVVDEYEIDISQYRSLESLEPLFEQMQKEEPDYTMMSLNRYTSNFFVLDQYEYVISKKVPLMVQSTDANLQIVNIYETKLGQQRLNTIRDYYQKGYINQDAAVAEERWQSSNRQVLVTQGEAGPYPDSFWSADRGYDVVANQAGEAIITSESCRGAINCVSASSNYKEESVQFLNLLNTDAEIRNLLNFGIEGVHYKLSQEDQVILLNNRYSGVQYTLGNFFILKTIQGDPVDKWEQYEAFNETAIESYALGFSPDLSDSKTQQIIQRIEEVNEKYFPALMTGTVDPNVELPKFIKELQDAGIDELKEMMQQQMDTWKQEKSKRK